MDSYRKKLLREEALSLFMEGKAITMQDFVFPELAGITFRRAREFARIQLASHFESSVTFSRAEFRVTNAASRRLPVAIDIE